MLSAETMSIKSVLGHGERGVGFHSGDYEEEPFLKFRVRFGPSYVSLQGSSMKNRSARRRLGRQVQQCLAKKSPFLLLLN